MLGMCYLRGDGVPENKEEAIKWFRIAAERGEPNAIYLLALCYFKGEGVLEDKAEAIRLYHIAAEKGDTGAQYELGECYYNGDGVPQDKAEAIKWYKKAGVNWYARTGLIRCYVNGDYVPDMEELEDWLSGLRWLVEFANDDKAKDKEYWQELAREAAELLREIEVRKNNPMSRSTG